MATGFLTTACWCLLLSQGASDVIYTNQRNHAIPVNIQEAVRPNIREVLLYTSTDQGRNWQQAGIIPPTKKEFAFYSPGDGTVGARQVRPGQLVSPGTQVISFVDKTKWVEANYRETQLTNVKVGDPVELRIDKYPSQTIHGKVVEIAPASGSQFALLPPDNATGNFTKVIQRVPVKIALDDPELATRLRPGLSATATVRTTR